MFPAAFSWKEASLTFETRFAILRDIGYYSDMEWRGKVHTLCLDFEDAVRCCLQLAAQEHSLMLVSGESKIDETQIFSVEQARMTFLNSYTVIEEFLHRTDGCRSGFVSLICSSEEEAQRYFDWCGRQGRGSACLTKGQNINN